MRAAYILRIGEEVEAHRTNGDRKEVFAVELCKHREDHLDDKHEVGDAEPGYLAIAH